MSDDLVSRIDDLIVQATKERSHYYTASVLKEARLALTGVRAEIDRLRESAKGQLVIVNAAVAGRNAAESELSTLRARASELAGENTNLRNDLVQRGMAEESLHEARCLEISDLIKTRLLGVAPDDQDLVLEDSDWAHIIQALERVAP